MEIISRRGFVGALAAGGAAAALNASAQSNESKQPGTLLFTRRIPEMPPCDVAVCGGGPAGIAAALAARRSGHKVLLVEGRGQLGGMGVSGLVSHWLGGRTDDCSQWVVGGIFRTLAQKAAERGCALIPVPEPGTTYQPHGWHLGQLAAGIPFDPYGMAALLDEEIQAAGVELLLDTHAIETQQDGNRITHVIINNKSGMAAVPVRMVVDATGDADIAALSGCAVVKGQPEDGLMTPATLQFHVYGVDQDALAAYINDHKAPRFREEIKRLREKGEWPFPYDIFISVQLTEKGVMMLNTSRLVGIDGANGRSVTEGYVRGRKETQELLGVLRKHFPGFANARIKTVAPALGIRETRRITGEYVMTVADLVEGKEFEDTIGFSAYGWDLPDPKRPSYQPMSSKGISRKRKVTPLPYRALLPRPVENLICPGRAISVEREVLGPIRVMAPCMAMGEAAGAAAALALHSDIPLTKVNTNTLRETLRGAGAIVDWPHEA